MAEFYYPTLQWLLENGQNIVARNLYANQITSENKFLPYFSVEISSINTQGKEEVVLVSSTLRSGSCPTWSISGLEETSVLEQYYSSQLIVVKISSVTQSLGEKVIVAEERFDLTKLTVYRVAGTLSGMVFPINTIVLAIGDQYFSSSRPSPTRASSFDTVSASQSPYLTVTFENTRSHHLIVDAELKSFQQNALQIATDLIAARSSYQQLLSTKPEFLERKTQIEQQILYLHLQKRKKELDELRQANQRALQRNQYYQLKIDQSKERYLQHDQSIKEHQQKIASWKHEIKQKSEQLLKIKFTIEAKQIKLLYELQEIFPIEVRKNESLIRDIEIPNDLSAPAKDDELIAAGLGYVVHLLLLCSKYLEIPLRYQLLYMGSRSLVRDLIRDSTRDPVATYPLFKRGVEKERFEKAVSWLKGNIEFLLRARGLEYDPAKHFLSNLQLLFDCDSCAKARV